MQWNKLRFQRPRKLVQPCFSTYAFPIEISMASRLRNISLYRFLFSGVLSWLSRPGVGEEIISLKCLTQSSPRSAGWFLEVQGSVAEPLCPAQIHREATNCDGLAKHSKVSSRARWDLKKKPLGTVNSSRFLGQNPQKMSLQMSRGDI